MLVKDQWHELETVNYCSICMFYVDDALCSVNHFSDCQVCVKIFEQRGHQVSLLPTMKEAELCKVIGDFEGLVVRSATKVCAVEFFADAICRLSVQSGDTRSSEALQANEDHWPSGCRCR